MVKVKGDGRGIDRKPGIENSRDVRGLRNIRYRWRCGAPAISQRDGAVRRRRALLVVQAGIRVAINQLDKGNGKTCAEGAWK